MGVADLHAHTCHDAWGDGNQGVAELFQHVEEHTELDIIAITDHDSTSAAREGLARHQSGGYRFGFLPGVEVTNQAGHLLCYFPDGEIFDVPSLRPFWWTVRYAQERGAICVAAHPVYPPWLVATIEHGLGRGLHLDGVEAINAGIGDKAREKLRRITRPLAGRVALVGNSDAHDQSCLGAAFTRFDGSTVEDFLATLRAGRTEPVFMHPAILSPEARSFTSRRSLTRPGWVRNLWRELTA